MGLKILHSADWHLDARFSSVPEEKRSSLQRAQLEIPGRIADLARKENCDLMLLAGDLFDGTCTRESYEAVRDALERCGIPVFIAPGNHDFIGPGSPWTEEGWPQNVFIFGDRVESVAIPELSCRIYGAGFTSMDCPSLLEGFLADGGERYQIGVFHGDPMNLGSHYNPITAAQVRDSGLDYLALGHIHKLGAFQAGRTLCVWPGCPMGRGWDELGDKGVCIVTLGEETGAEPVSLGLPCFRQFTLDICGDAAGALRKVLPAGDGGSFYRITLTGYGKPDLAALQEEFSYAGSLELRDKTQEPFDLWSRAGEDSLMGVYFRLLQEASQGADPESLRRIRLAAEISQKLLEGRKVDLP